jgi:hypothetical protein
VLRNEAWPSGSFSVRLYYLYSNIFLSPRWSPCTSNLPPVMPPGDLQSSREHHSVANRNLKRLIHKSGKQDFREKAAKNTLYKHEEMNDGILGSFGETNPAKNPVSHKPQRNDRSGKDVTAVPDPVPDTGIDPSPEVSPETEEHHTSSLQPKPSTKSAFSALLAGSKSFSPLSPLITASPFSALPTVTIPGSASSTFTTFITPLPTGRPMINQTQRLSPHKIPTAIIVLLAVGSAFALCGVFVIRRVCSRPRKRIHPTPSLPILEDEFPDNRFAADGSPIFGGKERYSPRPPSASMWSWHQPVIKKPAPTAGYGRIGGDEGFGSRKGTDEKGYYDEKNQYLIATTPTPTNMYRAPVVQQAQAALTRAVSRLSATSMSLYPNSPLNGNDIGVAVDGSPPFTADGHAVIKRTKPKGGGLRASTIARNDDRETVYSQYSQGFAYGGADVASPMPLTTSLPTISITPAAASGGRSRIKSTYFASGFSGTYPRSSAGLPPLPMAKSVQNPFEDSQHTLSRSESRRDRDTNALTSALGLNTPEIPPPSPQPTLYPEDSISDVGRDSVPPLPPVNKFTYKKPILKPSINTAAPQNVLTSPATEAGAALGNLMLTDFGTTASLAYLKDAPTSSSLNSLAGKKKLVSDKPPRVPSPPPLPSLTQMGLAHANPEGYADYRSPTYSIYGLYQSGDRKSRVNSFGY